MSTPKQRLEEAKSCFEETLDGKDPDSDAEKYNLYMGLWCIADALQQIYHEIDIMKDDVRVIRAQVDR